MRRRPLLVSVAGVLGGCSALPADSPPETNSYTGPQVLVDASWNGSERVLTLTVSAGNRITAQNTRQVQIVPPLDLRDEFAWVGPGQARQAFPLVPGDSLDVTFDDPPGSGDSLRVVWEDPEGRSTRLFHEFEFVAEMDGVTEQ